MISDTDTFRHKMTWIVGPIASIRDGECLFSLSDDDDRVFKVKIDGWTVIRFPCTHRIGVKRM